MKKRLICTVCVVVILMMEVVLPLFYGSYVKFLLDGLTNLVSMIVSCTAGMVLLYYSGGFDWMCEHLIKSSVEDEEDEE